MNTCRDKSKAFTIIELLVVISIVSVLAAILVSNLGQYITKVRDVKRKVDIENIMVAVNMYRTTHDSFPALSTAGCGIALTGSDPLFQSIIADKVMSKAPTVPSNSGSCGGAYYAYTWPTGKNKSIAVFTKLEKADAGCTPWAGQYYTSGSYCNGFYIQVFQ